MNAGLTACTHQFHYADQQLFVVLDRKEVVSFQGSGKAGVIVLPGNLRDGEADNGASHAMDSLSTTLKRSETVKER